MIRTLKSLRLKSEDQPMTDEDDSRFNEGADDDASGERLSRRSFLVAAAALGAAVEMDAGSTALAQRESATGTRTPSSGEELVLYNGKVRTMDDRDSVVSAVRIRGNRFAEVGNFNVSGPNAIDLGGRTVIPGLIESCDHIVSFGNYRPGYHTVLENATRSAPDSEIGNDLTDDRGRPNVGARIAKTLQEHNRAQPMPTRRR